MWPLLGRRAQLLALVNQIGSTLFTIAPEATLLAFFAIYVEQQRTACALDRPFSAYQVAAKAVVYDAMPQGRLSIEACITINNAKGWKAVMLVRRRY